VTPETCADYLAVAERALAMSAVTPTGESTSIWCAFASDEQAQTLGLPSQPAGWGLVGFDDGHRQISGALDQDHLKALVAKRHPPGWQRLIRYWANGNPWLSGGARLGWAAT
jgi:hypothetical protein